MVTYEIFSFGKMPYAGMTNPQVMETVPQGYRLPQPSMAPDAIYLLMLQAMAVNDRTRPKFAELEPMLRDVRDRLRQGRNDADLVCSQARNVSRTGSLNSYVEPAALTASLAANDKRQKQNARAQKTLLSMSLSPHDEAEDEVSGDCEAVAAATNGAAAAAGYSKVERRKQLAGNAGSTASVITFEGGYMLLNGGGGLGRLDNCIVLDPDGLDTRMLSDSEAPVLVRQAIVQSGVVVEPRENHNNNNRKKTRRDLTAGDQSSDRLLASQRDEPAVAAGRVEDDGNLPPVVLRTVHNGVPMYLTVNPEQIAPDMLDALLQGGHGGGGGGNCGEGGAGQAGGAVQKRGAKLRKNFLGLATEAQL